MSESVISLLGKVFTPIFGVLLILTGIYSLTINKAEEKRKIHPKNLAFIKYAGLLYIISGAVIVIRQVLF